MEFKHALDRAYGGLSYPHQIQFCLCWNSHTGKLWTKNVLFIKTLSKKFNDLNFIIEILSLKLYSK